MRMPDGATTLYFRVVATVNGTLYESPERTVEVTNLPDFLFVLYSLFASNLLYLALFILALAAVVAFIPQRRGRARRTAYHARSAYPGYRPVSPPPAPPPQTQAPPGPPAAPSTARPVIPPPPPIEFIRPQAPPPAVPAASAPSSTAPSKKRCPGCGTMVNADNLFCFFCGHMFR